MKQKQRKLQIGLGIFGLVLFGITYLYYPNINKDQISEKEADERKILSDAQKKEFTTFENLEFKGLYDLNKPFTVKSDTAYIKEEDPDVVHMSNMHVILYLENNRTINITSLEGRYNKVNYDCFFEKNVLATDGETTITSENLDLFAEKNIIEMYNNVNLNYPTGSMLAEKMQYDFITKVFKITDNDSVKVKIIQ
tara:strand:- start:3144 stop:3728 length:585 start_codon:yes stop_codon:yes gene_type:complete